MAAPGFQPQWDDLTPGQQAWCWDQYRHQQMLEQQRSNSGSIVNTLLWLFLWGPLLVAIPILILVALMSAR